MTGRVLITGASGFVGSHLARHLAARSHPLRLAVRRQVERPDGDVEIVPVGAVGARTDWAQAIAGIEAVIHTAAHVHVAPERAEAEASMFDEVNVRGTVRLFDAAAAAGVRLFVFLSSVTVLGAEHPAGQPFTDDTPPGPLTPYARSKLAAERALAARTAAYPGIRLVILRPPLVCGPGVKGNLRSLLRLAATSLPLPLGGIGNRRTLLSLDNLASAVDAVLARRDGPMSSAPYLLGDRDSVSTSAIVATLREGLDRSPGLVRVPAGFMRMVAGLIGRPGTATRLYGDLAVDSSRFRRDFGWTDVTDTRTTLRLTAKAGPVPNGRGLW